MKYNNSTPQAPKGMSGEMGQASAPKSCDVLAPQKSDMGKIQEKPMGNLGYPKQAWDYKY